MSYFNGERPTDVTGSVTVTGPVAVVGDVAAFSNPPRKLVIIGGRGADAPFIDYALELRVSTPGAMFVTSTVAAPLWITGTTDTVVSFPAGFNSNITQSIPLNVTSTVAAPLWVTGVLTVNTDTQINITQSIPLNITSTVANPVFISGTILVSGTKNYPLWVSSTLTTPVWITGSVSQAGNILITGSTVWLSSSIVGTVPVSSTNVISATLVGQTTWLSSSVVGGSSASYGWVTASGSATLLRATAAGRKGITFYNSGTTAAYVLLDNGSWASAVRFTCVVGTGGYYEAPYGWTGQVSALWVGTPGGSGSVTEVF